MGWKNKTLKTSEAMIEWMESNNIKKSEVVSIVQDILGSWHVIYDD